MTNQNRNKKTLFTTQAIKATLILAGGIVALSNGMNVEASGNEVGNEGVVTTQSSNLTTSERVQLQLSKHGRLPVDEQNYKITSHFGPRIDPITKKAGAFHNGLDISAANISGANIYSVLPGKVVNVNYNANGLGHYIVVEHDGLTVTYAHMQQRSNFNIGDTVSTSDVIGAVGTTGRSTGPHLHLEMKIDGQRVNPFTMLEDVLGVENETYKVVSGDTLYKISQEYGTTVANLKSYNNLTSDLILVGQELVVNKKVKTEDNKKQDVEYKAPVSSSAQPTPQGGESITNTTYKIKYGDTLSKIATSHKTSVNAIKSLNNLRSDLIITGQTLVIPGQQGTQSKPSTPTQTVDKTHKVVSGDTLYRLAINNGTTVSRLKSFNNLKSDLIIVGQTLTIK